MKEHYERYSAGEKTVPVLLTICANDGRIISVGIYFEQDRDKDVNAANTSSL